MNNIDEFIDFADALAETVRPIIVEAFEIGYTYEIKDDGSPVTEIDREIEQIMRREIKKQFPNFGILGEEFGTEKMDAEYIWVLDPIDGTKAFATGLPNFGSLIALCHNRRPVLGIIELPLEQMRAIGVKNRPTLCNGNPVKTRNCQALIDAVVCSCGPDSWGANEPKLKDVRERSNWRVYDGGCAAYVSLARGYLDICIDATLDPFDFCALVPVIEGAGGMITDWQGETLTLSSGKLIVATGTAACHQEILDCLG
jgi:histidinol-phosphatase